MPTHAVPQPDLLLLPSPSNALAEVALKGFFQVADRWGLNAREQMALLGQPPRSTYFAWKEGTRAVLGRDTLDRISCILGIFKALRLVLPDAAQALLWLRKPNSSLLFEGAAPLEAMTRGQAQDLADVRRLLEARMGVL